MKKKGNGKKVISLMLAAMLAGGLTACADAEQTGGDINQNGTESTSSTGENTDNTENTVYALTEENTNKELTMNNQPEAPYWFPSTLLEWEPEEDEDFQFNVGTVPLAERADIDKLETVNATQNKETKVMALSIMNGSTSGNAPHGLNIMEANTFTYWQYVDTLVYWGGSSGEGVIVAPSADVIDAAHKNGVKVLGTIFMPQIAHGGKIEWLNDLLTKDEDGSYPVAEKLIEAAKAYGFDGWFMNQETGEVGADVADSYGMNQQKEEGAETLSVEHAERMQEFMAVFKEMAPELDMVYYDSMTSEGKMSWQNALTDKNISFLKDEEGNEAADSMFLNFWWTEDVLADRELVKSSAELAVENELDPYDLYAGIDLQSKGYDTDINWSLFEKPEGGTYTSLGIYCPSWTYFSSDMVQDFWKKENKLWVNAKGDPSAEITPSSDKEWRGISTYVVERTAITELPFITNFSTGNGYSFFKNGEQVSLLDWNNRSISDILPTYRYIIDNEEGNKLTADLDVADAYYGGTSMILRGDMTQGKNSTIKLYSANLPVTGDILFTTTAKAKGAEVSLNAVVTLEDGSGVILEGDKKVGSEWTTVNFDASGLSGKTIRTLSYRLTAEADTKGLQFRFGNITMAQVDAAQKTTVDKVQVVGKDFDEDGMYAGVRLSWEADVSAAYYEVYRINSDLSKSLLGVSNTTSFYINTLPRTDETGSSTFEVLPVNEMLEDGNPARTTMEWPDNSIPKAGFAADVTLLAPGEKVTFTSLCSQNTEDVTWSLPGSDQENAQGESITVAYQEEGVYNVTVKAENASGSSEAAVEGYIVVTEKAADGLSLLSMGAAAEADTYVNEKEAPEFAVDGDVTKKWCATGSAPHEITLDLGEIKAVGAVDISHAEAGGEGKDMNTKAYTILTSEDGVTFEEATNVTKNTAGITHDALAPVNARYIKVVINKPSQGSDSAARIYEIEVFGLTGALE